MRHRVGAYAAAPQRMTMRLLFRRVGVRTDAPNERQRSARIAVLRRCSNASIIWRRRNHDRHDGCRNAARRTDDILRRTSIVGGLRSGDARGPQRAGEQAKSHFRVHHHSFWETVRSAHCGKFSRKWQHLFTAERLPQIAALIVRLRDRPHHRSDAVSGGRMAPGPRRNRADTVLDALCRRSGATNIALSVGLSRERRNGRLWLSYLGQRSLIARHTFSLVSGISMCLTPNVASASMTALTTAGIAP
jgi:hypothetical protein